MGIILKLGGVYIKQIKSLAGLANYASILVGTSIGRLRIAEFGNVFD